MARDVVVELKTAMNNYPNSGHVNISIEHARALLALIEVGDRTMKLLERMIPPLDVTMHTTCANAREALAEWEENGERGRP